MKTLLYTLLGVALVATVSSGTFLNLKNGEDKDLQAVPSNLLAASMSFYSYIEEDSIDNLIVQLEGQTNSAQLQIIQSFVYQQHKFFNSASIKKILTALTSYYSEGQYSIRSIAILLMKPYVSPLSTNEAIQIINMMDPFDGIACGILINQINDLSSNEGNKGLLSNLMSGYLGAVRRLVIFPQATKYFSKFQITTEGQHVGFLFDQSESMNSIAFTAAYGKNVTRFGMLSILYQNIQADIFQHFQQFSYLFLGYGNVGCDTCSIGDYNRIQNINHIINYYTECSGAKDLYEKLSQIASKPYSTLSDLYIWSDGVVPSGTQGISDFIKLIDSINAQRRIKIRINTFSFLVGGNEDARTRITARALLQALSDYTNGTFIQIQPNMF